MHRSPEVRLSLREADYMRMDGSRRQEAAAARVYSLFARLPSHDRELVGRGRGALPQRPISVRFALEAPEAGVRVYRFGVILRRAGVIARSSA